jgi:CheY-like chemotaxis protein
MRLAVQHVLGEMQLQNVHVATQGYEAKHILENTPISLVISDWNMPGMSGFDLLNWCRQDERYRNLPFILQTAESSREQLSKALEAGVSDYLVKPFTSAVLRARIARLLSEPETRGGVVPAKPLKVDLPILGLDAPSDERLAKSTVLVVDDIATNIEVIAGILKQDYSVKVAINGRKALEICNGSAPPDIILLDVMMPEMDGYEVCRQLKANDKTRDIPVIFLTAKDQADDIVDGFDLGAVDYIAKPVQPTVLKARLRTHLRLNQAVRDLNRQNATLTENARLRDDIERITRHDLKNPISAIVHTAESLLEDEVSTATVDRLQLLRGAARHALELVNISLTLYRIEQGIYRADKQDVDLRELVTDVVDEIKTQFAWKPVNIVLNATSAAHACVEAVLCHSALGNLVKNAVEASPDDCTVAVSLLSVGNEVLIEITNQGAVPTVIRDRFFDKYVTHGKADGTGLGTYSAKVLTEAQGGRLALRCDDAQNRTHLSVYLPVAHAANPPA